MLGFADPPHVVPVSPRIRAVPHIKRSTEIRDAELGPNGIVKQTIVQAWDG